MKYLFTVEIELDEHHPNAPSLEDLQLQLEEDCNEDIAAESGISLWRVQGHPAPEPVMCECSEGSSRHKPYKCGNKATLIVKRNGETLHVCDDCTFSSDRRL